MKAIKITDDNKNAIIAALAEVNGKATAHVFTGYHQIAKIRDFGETELERLSIPQSKRAGAKVVRQSGEILPMAYKSAAQSTLVHIERRSSAWYLVNVERSPLYPRSKPKRNLILTADQDGRAVEALRRNYAVARASAEISVSA